MVAQERQAFGIEFVDPPCTLAPVSHEPCLFECTQVLGDGRPRYRQARGQFVYGARVCANHFEDREAGRIA